MIFEVSCFERWTSANVIIKEPTKLGVGDGEGRAGFSKGCASPSLKRAPGVPELGVFNLGETCCVYQERDASIGT